MGCFFSGKKGVDVLTVSICYMSPFMIVTILIMWWLLQCDSKSEEERYYVGYQRKNFYSCNSSYMTISEGDSEASSTDIVISVEDSGTSTKEN